MFNYDITYIIDRLFAGNDPRRLSLASKTATWKQNHHHHRSTTPLGRVFRMIQFAYLARHTDQN